MPTRKPNEIQKIYSNTVAPKLIDEANRQAQMLSFWYASELENGRGNIIYQKNDIPFDVYSWNENATKATVDGMIEATNEGLGGAYSIASVSKTSKYYLGLEVDGVTLSSTLRSSAKEAGDIARDTINRHIKNKTTWKRLTDEFTSRRLSDPDLPKYLRELSEQAKLVGGNTKELRRSLRYANSRVMKLSEKSSNVALKRAYQSVITAVERGDTSQLDKLMQRAMNQKAVYNNKRIARTELQRANSMAFKRQMIDHPEYENGNVYVKVSLSSGHNVIDVCDYLTGCDCHNLGAGVYPSEEAPSVPFHPNCLCMLRLIVKYDIDRRKTRFSEARTEQYLNSRSENARKRIETSINNTTLTSISALPVELLK